MSLKEWLPLTTRNRVALGLAALALVMLVVWNCSLVPDYGVTVPQGVVAMSFWPIILSPETHLPALKYPNMRGFIDIAASLAVTQNALVSLVAIPFWKLLHVSSFIRLSLALVNLLGGAVIFWVLYDHVIHKTGRFGVPPMLLMGLSMFTFSAALFVFKNELALREERNRPSAD